MHVQHVCIEFSTLRGIPVIVLYLIEIPGERFVYFICTLFFIVFVFEEFVLFSVLHPVKLLRSIRFDNIIWNKLSVGGLTSAEKKGN